MTDMAGVVGFVPQKLEDDSEYLGLKQAAMICELDPDFVPSEEEVWSANYDTESNHWEYIMRVKGEMAPGSSRKPVDSELRADPSFLD